MYYIKGNEERGAEVIKALVDKGGNNTRYSVSGTDEAGVYYIDKLKDIRFQCDPRRIEVIKEFCEELTLPEKWKPRYKLEDKIYSSTYQHNGFITVIDYECKLYRILLDVGTSYWVHEDDLSEVKWSPKRGETVLVRNSNGCAWIEAVYSFTDTEEHPKDLYCTVGGSYWNFCIPFDENKLGKVTED